MARADAERVPPAWLRPLLEATFFEACPEHLAASRATRSAGCNFFCTRCTGRALCSVCIAGDGHPGHQLIQVRKSSYHSVVKVAEHLLNVSMVQTYLINGDKVVFLNPRPMTRQGKPGAVRCEGCDRGLQDAGCRFCSLRCKLEGMDDDFSVSFAVQPKSDIESNGDLDSESDDDSSQPTKFRKLETLTGSGHVATIGNRSGKEGAKTSAKP